MLTPSVNNRGFQTGYLIAQARRHGFELRLQRGGMSHLKAMLLDERDLLLSQVKVRAVIALGFLESWQGNIEHGHIGRPGDRHCLIDHLLPEGIICGIAFRIGEFGLSGQLLHFFERNIGPRGVDVRTAAALKMRLLGGAANHRDVLRIFQGQ